MKGPCCASPANCSGKGNSPRFSTPASVPVWLGLGNEEGYPHEGYLDFANNEFTASTATLHIRGVFPNPKPAVGDRLLSPAMLVTCGWQ